MLCRILGHGEPQNTVSIGEDMHGSRRTKHYGQNYVKYVDPLTFKHDSQVIQVIAYQNKNENM